MNHDTMNHDQFLATWHKASFDHFLNESLPQLLAERLPLAGYAHSVADDHTCAITVTVAGPEQVTTIFKAIPYPTTEGLFKLNGEWRTVVPWVAHSDLDSAAVNCVGELLYEWVAEQLGNAPADLPWDEPLLRAWLPLDKWVREFMLNHRHAQSLDMTNWLARQCHLRRIFINDRTALITPGQRGRVDPFEMPEGPNLGRIFTLALGASIGDGAIVIDDDSDDDRDDDRAEATLGSTSVMIPCLEHDDPNRLLMGANMMRQWLPYSEPEPALVQTGNEPNAPHFWCGRNLLTAFMPWGEGTFEDGLVLSESATRRLSNLQHTEIPWFGGQLFDLYHEIEPGDKLSNRHGTKGVVCQIMADDQMPRLADGTPVELIMSSLRLPGRMNLGQLWEAVLGRLARHEGTPVFAPPFHGPSESEIRERLVAAALPADGMETLLDAHTPYAHPSLVGWVYWGRTNHLARDKMAFAVNESQQGQLWGDLEVAALRKIGAMESVREHFLTRAAGRKQDQLAAHEAIRATEQSAQPTVRFEQLQQRLAAAGIHVDLVEGALHFSFGPIAKYHVASAPLTLAQPLSHPWLPAQSLTELGLPATVVADGQAKQPLHHNSQIVADLKIAADYTTIAEMNKKLKNLVSSSAPAGLIAQVHQQLVAKVNEYLELLLQPGDLRLRGRALFTGRAVLASGAGLAHDQIGLPEEMAWAFFGPQVAAAIGEQAVAERTFYAEEYLDEIMSDAWVLLHHAPVAEPTALLAFRPLRMPERVVRIPSLACPLLDADFDGDQIAVHLPTSEAGQREARERLSIAGHLTRDPSLLERLTKQDDAIWGLANSALDEQGRQEIVDYLPSLALAPGELVTRVNLVQALRTMLSERGADETLRILRMLMLLGFARISTTGFSMSPFATLAAIDDLTPAVEADPTNVQRNLIEIGERFLAEGETELLWPYGLAIKSGAAPETQLRTLLYCLGMPRRVEALDGRPIIVTRGFTAGLTPDDFWQIVPGARTGMGRIWQEWEALELPAPTRQTPVDFGVLARARRSPHPGIVFAQAAASGEIDPLTDEESRLFVGLAVAG